MTITKVIIVDDEADARKLIRQYLVAHANFQIVAEASNGLEAVEVINEHQPNLVFLDIQMPGLNGFEVLTKLVEIPKIIFSTAYDSFAIKAFEVHALDYLLKPYGRKRFDQALSRLELPNQNLQPLTEELLGKEEKYPVKIFVQKGTRFLLLDTTKIIRIEAYGDYSKVVTQQHEYLSNSGIGLLETKLNPADFKRIHRSYIVNFNKVIELRKEGRVHSLILENKDEVRISNGYLEEIKRLIY